MKAGGHAPMILPSVVRITSKSSDAIRALRRTPPWAVVVVCVVALALTWFGWKLLGMREQDSLTIDLAAEEFPATFVAYSSAPLGLGATEYPIPPEEVTPLNVEARAATVSVTPLGGANPQSRGNEVWLVQVTSEYARVGGVDWAKMALPEPWIVSGESALNAPGTPVPLSVGLDAGAYVDATLVTHPWSGRVRIDAAGRSREIDLYTPDSGANTFRLMLPVSPEAPRRVAQTIPRAAGDITLGFSDGPQTVRLTGAQRRGASVWNWKPETADDTVLGPGVKVLARDSGGVLIGVPDGGGWVRLANTAQSYWFPRLNDVAVVLGTWLVALGLGLLGAAVIGALAGTVAVFGSLRPSHSSGAPARSRRQVLVDGILLVAASAWLFVLVGGALLGVREVAAQVESAKAFRAQGVTALIPSSDNIGDWISSTPGVRRWWGTRPAPRPDGGDYLKVLSRESGETIADILGFAALRAQKGGVPFKTVIIPNDLEALYGQKPFFEREGMGDIGWQKLPDVGAFFTDVAYVERNYDPVLTEQQLAGIPGTKQSQPAWSALVVSEAPAGASGTWVLYAVRTSPRKYALVPIEASPMGQRP